tara:strand:- start:531 stop:734 length:204 start_codon:yes stop_codon:yes gene_type:complete
MRNYELINEIYAELVAGDGKGTFSNSYLNTVIKLTKLIEQERPELKELTEGSSVIAAKRENWEKNAK